MRLVSALLSFCMLVASCLASFSSIQTAQAAPPRGYRLIKTASSGDMYVDLSFGRYKVKNAETWNRWQFTWNDVVVISDAQMAAIPRGPDFGIAFRPFNDPTVYVVDNGTARAVTSPDALKLAGYDWTDIAPVEQVMVKAFLDPGPILDIPPVVRSPSDGKIYYIAGGKRYHIVDQDTWNNWGFNGYTESAYVNQIPEGGRLTRLVRPFGDPTVYVIDNGKKRVLPSPDALILNDFSWANVVDADVALIAATPLGDPFWAPTTVTIPGSATRYLISGGIRYPILDDDTFNNWGFGSLGTRTTAAATSYPVGPTLTRLPRAQDGTVWRVKDSQRRSIPTAGTFDGYGFSWAQVTDIPITAVSMLANLGLLDFTVTTLQNLTLPFTEGKTGLEQHLKTTLGDTTSEEHYTKMSMPLIGNYLTCSGSRGCLRNGLAGQGAFGLLAPDVERWYITMRWNYCTWTEAATATDDFSKPMTLCQNPSLSAKNAHNGKRIIVSNPRTGKKIVTAIGESGPAIWVTRERGVVSGLSPEGIDALEATYNAAGDVLTYGWAADQTLPLGPLAF